MTRYFMTIDNATDILTESINDMRGGEIFIPKIPSYKITEVAEAIGPNCKKKIIAKPIFKPLDIFLKL